VRPYSSLSSPPALYKKTCSHFSYTVFSWCIGCGERHSGFQKLIYSGEYKSVEGELAARDREEEREGKV
jgi:hypothetical protein